MKHIERTFFESANRFFEPYKYNKPVTARAIMVYGLWSIGNIIHILFVQQIIITVEAKQLEGFGEIIGMYVGVLVVYYIILFLIRKWGWVETTGSYRKVIQGKYLPGFIKLSNTEVEKMGTGKTISLIDSGMDNWALYLGNTIHECSKIFMAIIFTVYMIMSVNVLYAVIFFCLYVGVHFIAELFNRRSIFYRRKRQDTRNSYVGYVVKMLMSKFEILQAGRINSELAKVDYLSDRLIHWNRHMATPHHWLYFFPEMFMSFVKITFFVFLGYQIILGNASFATFVGLFGLLTLMDTVIESSVRFYSHFTKDFTKIEKMWDFFDSTPDIKGYEEGADFQYKTGKIELQNMSFGYGENKKVFDNFSLKIEGEKITALVGNSGSGKSTLVKLISGYIRQDQGKILVDDQNLEETSLKSYYKSIGYLTQEPSVFDGTIRENLMYGIDENNLGTADLQSLLGEVILLSKCEFIYELENGLDTEIGEKGVRLSGGQRQRIAIAKIMLSDPEIIILDEPTSALDSFSEEQITKALNNLFTGRTVIVIAHRLQTVKHAHRILVLESGRVVEEGNHKELVQQKGIYKNMLDLQSGF